MNHEVLILCICLFFVIGAILGMLLKPCSSNKTKPCSSTTTTNSDKDLIQQLKQMCLGTSDGLIDKGNLATRSAYLFGCEPDNENPTLKCSDPLTLSKRPTEVTKVLLEMIPNKKASCGSWHIPDPNNPTKYRYSYDNSSFIWNYEPIPTPK